MAKTRMVIRLDGQTYMGKASEEPEYDEAVKEIYKHINELDRLQMPLEDGSTLILRQEQMERAAILICPADPTPPEPT